MRAQGIISTFPLEQGIWREIDPRGRFVRVEASIDSRGAGRLERSARRFLPEPWGGGPAMTGDEEKAIEALGNPDSGFTKVT